MVAREDVAAFIEDFASALASGDTTFVEARLHPDVKDAFGLELCRAWIEREIMALSNYELISIDGGPVAKQLTFPGGIRTVADMYEVTVSFVFGGQTFTNPTDLALVGTKMYWLGECR